MCRDSFSSYHPLVNFLFFLAVGAITMLCMQPVYVGISLVCGCGYLLHLKGVNKGLRLVGYALPLILAMAVLNPVFNHEGATILYYLPNDNPITLEAICYGIAAAGVMGAALMWLNCLNCIFTTDKTIYLFGRVVPAASLLISMTLRFVPRFKQHLISAIKAQHALNNNAKGLKRLKAALYAFSATISYAMENAIQTADSMKSRGYGLLGRTAFSLFIFSKRDAFLMLALLLLCTGACVPLFDGSMHFAYYPLLAGKTSGTKQIFAYMFYFGLCMLPTTTDIWEGLKWRCLKQKI